MIVYNYNQQFIPPAPLVHVAIRSPDGNRAVKEFPARIDHGADRTIIPAKIAKALELLPVGEVSLSGFGGVVVDVRTFRIVVGIREMPAFAVNAASHEEEPLVLLGRDLLNHYRIVLDGPRLKVEID